MGVGISGLPEGRADTVREFRDVTSRLAKLHSSGYRVAVLDPHEAIYCLASGVPPATATVPCWVSSYPRSNWIRPSNASRIKNLIM